MSRPQRLIIIGVALLLALLLQAAPASVAVPVQIVTRPAVETVLSAAPPSGPVVTLELPADRLHNVPLVEMAGQPHMMRGQRP